MADLLKVDVGEYTLIKDSSGELCVRHGGFLWNDPPMKDLVLEIAHEVKSLRETQAVLLGVCKVAVDALGCDRVRTDRLVAQEIIHKAVKKAEA